MAGVPWPDCACDRRRAISPTGPRARARMRSPVAVCPLAAPPTMLKHSIGCIRDVAAGCMRPASWTGELRASMDDEEANWFIHGELTASSVALPSSLHIYGKPVNSQKRPQENSPDMSAAAIHAPRAGASVGRSSLSDTGAPRFFKRLARTERLAGGTKQLTRNRGLGMPVMVLYALGPCQ